MPRHSICVQPTLPRRRLGAFIFLGLVASLWIVPATSYAQDAVYQGKLGGKREGKQFVGRVGPKSANVRFRAKPKGNAMVLTLIEAGKKPQTVTLRRVRK
ncbi:MAG: hypothetical protein HKN97_04930 [Myxococcales bacterium]|nr:hypothetical protein [Deltaproteobacteria bacterium]NND27914.1 hypothetical protein [Myxococcales bacterium]MBT8483459.1 hypothetical protein [Deltaproteobacteria bacterium]NNK07261.1 hypothetical protein [Myxococcales bacterium]NNK42157.1 hypothetical protein [Myxococcales bacterium]